MRPVRVLHRRNQALSVRCHNATTSFPPNTEKFTLWPSKIVKSKRPRLPCCEHAGTIQVENHKLTSPSSRKAPPIIEGVLDCFHTVSSCIRILTGHTPIDSYTIWISQVTQHISLTMAWIHARPPSSSGAASAKPECEPSISLIARDISLSTLFGVKEGG